MRVCVAIADPARDRGLIDVAVALAGAGPGDEILLVSVIEVSDGGTLAAAQPEARARRRQITALAEEFAAPSRIRTIVTVARQGWSAVTETVAKERPDLLLVGWRRPGWDVLGTTIEDILRDPPCDLAVVKGPVARAKHLLIPVRGGRYAELAASLGVTLARARGGSVTLLHVVTEDQAARRTRATPYQMLGERAFDAEVDQILTRVGDATEIIADELATHDAVVIGASGGNAPLGPV
ncbi:MAG TPA: universal stress protein, partial [Candidatus Saccharimonadales bacterium]|nr:universal stress protein [Candidatus Saccharimonadales bacterium]